MLINPENYNTYIYIIINIVIRIFTLKLLYKLEMLQFI